MSPQRFAAFVALLLGLIQASPQRALAAPGTAPDPAAAAPSDPPPPALAAEVPPPAASSAQTRAPASSPATASTTPTAPRPMPVRLQLRMLGFGALTASAALAVSAGIGAATYTGSNCGDDCKEDENFGEAITAYVIASGLTLVTVPLAAALTVRAIGNRHGYRGRFLGTYLGSLVGVAAASGVMLMIVATREGSTNDIKLGPTIAGGAMLGLISVGSFSMLGYRLSDHLRVNVWSAGSSLRSVGLNATVRF